MVQDFGISTVWLAIPTWGRAALMFLLASVVLYLVMTKLGPLILKLATGIILKLMELLSFILILLLAGFSMFRKNNTSSEFVLKIEKALEKLLNKLKDQYKNKSIKMIKRPAWWKKYSVFTVLAALLLAIMVSKQPDFELYHKWHEFDKWVINEPLKADVLEHKTAVAAFKTAVGLSGGVQVHLKPEYQAGYIFETPQKDGKKLQPIKKTDILYSLGEVQTDGTKVQWLKISTLDGTTGWVSMKTVQEMK